MFGFQLIERVDKIMETLRNCVGNTECSSVCLHSLVTVFNDSPFERGQIVAILLPGAFVTKTATLLSLSRVRVYKVMSVYTNRGKTTNAKRNNG
jgi:hypothetical protein